MQRLAWDSKGWHRLAAVGKIGRELQRLAWVSKGWHMLREGCRSQGRCGRWYHGVHVRRGQLLRPRGALLVGVGLEVQPALLRQQAHLVEQLVSASKVQYGNGAHLLPAPKHLQTKPCNCISAMDTRTLCQSCVACITGKQC